MAITANHTVRIALLSVAAILAILSIFLGWWTIRAEINGAERDTSARPFDAGEFADDEEGDEDGLSGEVIVTGIFATLAALTVVAYLVLEVLPAIGHASQPVARLILAFVSTALGLAAILYTTFAWPEGTGGDMQFFDRTEFDTSTPFGGNSGSISSFAGPGWWIEIAATILAPLVAFLVGLRDARPAPSG